MITSWSHCPALNPDTLEKPVAYIRAVTTAPETQPTVTPKKGGLKITTKSSADKPKAKKSEHSEKSIQRALAFHFDWQKNEVFFGVDFAGGIADFIMVTAARYIVEVEVKISLSDWNADQHKSKWAHPARKKISRFYYAVPAWLAEKAPAWLPAHVGILSVSEGGWVQEVRKPLKNMTYKAQVKDFAKFYRSTYYKYLTKWMKEGKQ